MIEMTKIRVCGDNIVDVIRILDNLKTASSSKAELGCLETSKANLLPGGHVVRRRGGGNSFTVFLQMDVAKSKFGVVVDTLEQKLGCIVKTLGEAAVTNVLNVGNIRSVDKLLKISQIVRFGVSVDEFSIQKIFLQVLACHLKEGNNLGVNLSFVRLGAHPHIFTGIFCANETQNSISSHLLLQLRITKLRPNRLLVNLICEGLSTVKILHEVNKDSHGKDLHFNLFILIGGVFRPGKLDVDGESFLVEHVTFRNANESNILGIEVVQLVNVGSDLGVVSTDGGEDEQVLKVLVVREV
mmetsp:Transcript_5790/g.8374  ORF Transcript_5790/g.8374 Transcript_5790/m.8374 type:complete len:298 (+) Transcript_5790:1293-2186(+)